MKRTATLVAGLLLVTGTVFASEWKVAGATVEGTYNLMHSEFGALGAEGEDLNLTLKPEKDFGKAGVVGVEAEFDKDGEDNSVKLTYSKTEGDFTVATSAKILQADDDTTDKHDAQISLKTDEGSDTYIKWNVMGSKTTTLTFYPWEVDGMSWDNDTWESFKNSNNNGGLTLATKVANLDTKVKFSATEGKSNADAKYTVKGEFGLAVAKAKVDAAVGYSNSSKTSLVAAKASLPMGKLTVNGEFNTTKVDKADAAVGIFAKVSYAMGDLQGYAATPYASFKMLNDVAAFEDEGIKSDYTEIEAGIGMAKGSFTITPKVIVNAADKAVYGRVNDADEKSAFKAGVKVAYGF